MQELISLHFGFVGQWLEIKQRSKQRPDHEEFILRQWWVFKQNGISHSGKMKSQLKWGLDGRWEGAKLLETMRLIMVA